MNVALMEPCVCCFLTFTSQVQFIMTFESIVFANSILYGLIQRFRLKDC